LALACANTLNSTTRPAESAWLTLVFDLRPLPPELHVLLRLRELQTVLPLEESLTGIAATHHSGLGDRAKKVLLAGVELSEEILHWLDRWLDRFEEELGGEAGDEDDQRKPKRRPVLRFTPPVYRAKASSVVAVKGVRLPAHGSGAALLVIGNGGSLPPGREYRFQVQQLVERRVVGGCTYVVRMGGRPTLPPPIVAPSHQIDPKTGRPPDRPPKPIRNVAPWMRDIAEERDEVLGKFPPEVDDPIG
jgi:hypothetical protein